SFIEHSDRIKDLRFEEDEDIDEYILDNLKMELHMMVFHSSESLFLNIFLLLKEAGFVTVRRGPLIDLINRLPEKEISSVAEYIAKHETKDFVLLLRNEYNIESALDVIETWIKISGHPYRHEVNYTRHSYVIQHDMGRNWSLYMAEQYRFLFEEFGLKRVEFDINDNTLDFVVDTER
ncbi:MAG: hypothetical protein ACJ706_00555, partial [Nitrososphaeraceae archaeon]